MHSTQVSLFFTAVRAYVFNSAGAYIPKLSAMCLAALEAFERGDRNQTRTAVLAGLSAARNLRSGLADMGLSDNSFYELDFRLAQKAAQYEQAALLVHDLQLEALANDGVVVPGQALEVELQVANFGQHAVAVRLQFGQ